MGLNLKELKRVEAPEVEVDICQVEPKGPVFRVRCTALDLEEFNEIEKKLSEIRKKGTERPGFRVDPQAQKRATEMFADEFCRRFIRSWVGLSLQNFDFLCKDGDLFDLSDPETKAHYDATATDKWTEANCIAFEHSAAVTLYRKALGEQFGDLIWEALKNDHKNRRDSVEAKK